MLALKSSRSHDVPGSGETNSITSGARDDSTTNISNYFLLIIFKRM